ncbi:alpha/beta hydrolase [Sphingobacterium corticibacter]|uniref:Alpha/beta hydrolase n=1 Tax=Sphingobacterium corticibacter TaxID=2171749 RepID=A0A2T8HKG1_9SPHI|nr:alpha/beta fold hydrolase [Sphingobacterium corticibacter]PVH25937.1 alpha/beta hydrolase [Sphingobacterium corticibacter]
MRKLINLLVLSMCLIPGLGFAQQYKQEDVIIKTKKDTIQIGATITVPASAGSFPALVLLSGTGAQDRDGTMAGQKLFAQVADYLSQRGYIVLRMDDRGVGRTTGNYMDATTADFAKDALEAVEYLKAYPQVDVNKIGLLGHSEGGAAMSIAASQSDDITFLVSLAGLATNGMESLLVQNENIVRNSPATPVDQERYNQINRLMFSTAYQYAESDSLHSKLNQVYDYWKLKDDLYFKTLGIEHDHFRFPIYSYSSYASGPWYRYFVRYNAEKVLSHVTVPILAINGDKDMFVDPTNLDGWKNYSQSGQKGLVTTILLPQVNHLMQQCVTCDTKEYAELGAMPISTLELVGDWLDKTVK